MFALEQIDSLAVRESYNKQAPFINLTANTVHNLQALEETVHFLWCKHFVCKCIAALRKSREAM